MIDPFLLKLVLSFIVGSTWITLSTVIAEKFGTKVGGVIGGFPSTIVITLFFIGWTQTPSIASQATSIVPIIVGINTLFILVYIALLKHNFYLSISMALITWLILSLGLVLMNFSDFSSSLIGFVLLLALSFYIIEKRFSIPSENRRPMHYKTSQLLFRGLFGGGIIASAVVIAKIGGPLIGGVFASFPVLMFSTMIITYFSHGKAFSSAFLKVVMMGTINVVIYTILVRYLYLSVGLIYGTVVPLLVSSVCGYAIYLFVSKKMI